MELLKTVLASGGEMKAEFYDDADSGQWLIKHVDLEGNEIARSLTFPKNRITKEDFIEGRFFSL